jgi:predicted Holliday junction resolvase-like endonuclease
MSRLRFRRLRIEVVTDAGLYGVDIPFADGLNVIRANNTRGKSTCFNSALYALGMDAIFTARHSLPLPHVLTSKLHADDLDCEIAVRDARIFLEIEGVDGVATVERRLTRDESRVIRLYDSATIDDALSGGARFRDTFIRLKGAATSESGFHAWLTGFIGWDLPNVEKFDGSRTLLYAETLFPLFFVEQRFGWGRVQGNTPINFGIRDVTRRATEFVLNLSSTDAQLQRNNLQQQLRSVHLRYTERYKSLQSLAEYEGAILRGIPEALHIKGDDPKATTLVFRDQHWIALSDRIAQLNEQIETKSIPSPDGLVSLGELESNLERERDDAEKAERQERQEQAATRKRMASIGEDLRKLTDTAVLARLGGTVNEEQFFARCPTCQQSIPDHVSPDFSALDLLPIQESIDLLKGELAVLSAGFNESSRAQQAHSAKRTEIEAEIERLRNERAALDVDTDGRIAKAIREAVLRQELTSLRRFSERLQPLFRELSALTTDARKLAVALDVIPVGHTDLDRKKLQSLEEVFKDQERDYGFMSFGIDAIGISYDTYKPTAEGFEMSFETSASDAIRTIWSYLVGMLEISRSFKDMAHIGLVAFDEPRQQSADKLSFGQLLRRASLSGHFDQQVLFFTSEDEAEVQSALDGSRHHLRSFSNRIIARLTP